MYEIQKRYQYYGPKGITWTSWFTYTTVETSKEAKQLVNKLKKDKSPNKLKMEFIINKT